MLKIEPKIIISSPTSTAPQGVLSFGKWRNASRLPIVALLRVPASSCQQMDLQDRTHLDDTMIGLLLIVPNTANIRILLLK